MNSIINEVDDLPIPFFSDSDSNVIAVSCSDEYAKFMCVYLYSLKLNSTPSNNYDIFILSIDISEDKKIIIKKFIEDDNISVRFYNPSKIIEKFNLKFVIKHWGISTYFRLIAPYIFSNFSKLVYTDVDMLLVSDIYEVFTIDMHSYPIAACYDVHSRVRRQEKWWSDYLNKVLCIHEPDDYFNAGFIIFDLNKYKELNLHHEMCNKILNLADANIIWADQDIINSLCGSKYYKLDPVWNYYVFPTMTSSLFSDYAGNLNNAKIYHYIFPKPWDNCDTIKADVWWEHALRTPFFDPLFILKRLASKVRGYYDNVSCDDVKTEYYCNIDTTTNSLDIRCSYIKFTITKIDLLYFQILINNTKIGNTYLYNFVKFANKLNCKELALNDNTLKIIVHYESLKDCFDYILDICFSNKIMNSLLTDSFCTPCSQLTFTSILESISFINLSFDHLHLFINFNTDKKSLFVVSVDINLIIQFIFTDSSIYVIFDIDKKFINCFSDSKQNTDMNETKFSYFFKNDDYSILDLYLQKLNLISTSSSSIHDNDLTLLSFHNSYLYYNAVERALFHSEKCMHFPQIKVFFDKSQLYLYFLIKDNIYYICDVDNNGSCLISHRPHCLNYVQSDDGFSILFNKRFLSANENHSVILQPKCLAWEIFSITSMRT